MRGDKNVHEVSTETILADYDGFYREHYFKEWPEELLTRADQLLPRVAWAKDYVEDHPGLRVLDLGGLDGFTAFTLLAAGAGHATNVELSRDGTELCVSRAMELGYSDRLTVVNDSIEHFLDQPQEQYDLVTIFEVIEHLIDPQAVMEKVNKVLAPGGRVMISTPDWEGHFGEDDFHKNHAHLRIYTHKDEAMGPDAPSLPALIRSAGGVVEEVELWNDLQHIKYSLKED